MFFVYIVIRSYRLVNFSVVSARGHMCAGRGWWTGQNRYIFSIGNQTVKRHISF